METSENADEEEVYKKYWKVAVEDLDEDPEHYDPDSDDPRAQFIVRFAHSWLRHVLGHYGQEAASDEKDIIDAIQKGWDEGEYEYAMQTNDMWSQAAKEQEEQYGPEY